MRLLLSLFILIFSTGAFASPGGKDFSIFPKWQDVLNETKGTLQMQRTSPVTLNEVEKVNSEVNKEPYVPETKDKWLPPKVFYRKGGDCEDFAIAKYFRLYKQGVKFEDMFIVILENPLYPQAEADPLHAVLQVRVDGAWYVLDIPHPSVGNKGDKLIKAGDYYNKHIYYGINHNEWTRTPELK